MPAQESPRSTEPTNRTDNPSFFRWLRDLDQAVLTASAWLHPGTDGPAIDLAYDFEAVETLPENDHTNYTITPKPPKTSSPCP